MHVGYYILCLVLMLPLVAVTAFAALIESMANIGFWKTLVMGLGMLFDPLGDGFWADAALLGVLVLGSAGFVPGLRPFGVAFLAVAAGLAVTFVLLVSPRGVEWGLVWLLSPSIAGLALSAYCALRSFRVVTV
jgi:hypothetical protein